jgi:tousled-like kinase
VYIQESRRIAEEDNAKYAQSTPDFEAWPVLHGKYLLLSLLGKGGYSEVYKAYDLDQNIDIAVKFH